MKTDNKIYAPQSACTHSKIEVRFTFHSFNRCQYQVEMDHRVGNARQTTPKPCAAGGSRQPTSQFTSKHFCTTTTKSYAKLEAWQTVPCTREKSQQTVHKCQQVTARRWKKYNSIDENDRWTFFFLVGGRDLGHFSPFIHLIIEPCAIEDDFGATRDKPEWIITRILLITQITN